MMSSAAFVNGHFDKGLAENLIVLIPKDGRPTTFKQFLSISLCNVIYKTITEDVCEWINWAPPEIPGRSSTDNALVAQEIMQYMNHSKSKGGAIAAKNDLEEAYDRVSWNFLRTTVEEFGLPHKTVNLIMFCVHASSLTLLWNGCKLPNSFSSARGLRHGDPLSPYFFVIRMEKLSCLISKKISDRT